MKVVESSRVMDTIKVWFFSHLNKITALSKWANLTSGEGGGVYQEKHSLLQAFSRQFAETAQPDELLWKSSSSGNIDQTSVCQNQEGWKSRRSSNSPDRGPRDCRCLSNLSSAPKASGSSPSWSSFPGAAPPLPTHQPEQLQRQPDKRDYRRRPAHTELLLRVFTLQPQQQNEPRCVLMRPGKDKHTSLNLLCVRLCCFYKINSHLCMCKTFNITF